MEKPNLEYIEQLARGEDSIRKELIKVIKDEFPKELKIYLKSVNNYNYKEIEDNVHRIKHKFSILGLEKGYKNAMEFELTLRDQKINISQKDSFESTLKLISEFLKTI